MADVTFRDFAMAVMQKQTDTATNHLETLLGLAPADARRAADYFAQRSTDPAFMPKAMSLRTAVTSGSDDEIRTLLHELFDLDEPQGATALALIRQRYATPS